MKVLLCAINSQYIHSNPALYSLARAIEAMPAPPELITRQYSLNLPYETILRELYAEAPDILAFSAYIWNIALIERLAADLGRLLPQTRLFLGGPEATPRAVKLLANWPHLQGVICGEGELTWPLLLTRLLAGESCPALAGVYWRETAGVVEAGATPDLAALPFPYTDEDFAQLKEERKVIYYESSRGCPYRCSFCASATAPLRERPLELVLQELPLLARAGGQIKFVDRTFNADPARAITITKKLLELYRPGLSWHLEISPYALPEVLLDLFTKAPPDYLRLEAGVQSLNPRSLAAIGRRGAWPRAKAAIETILAADNAHLHLDLIAGLPEEDLQSFAAGFEKLHALAPQYLQLGFLKILPGSPLAAEAGERGLVYSPYPPYQILETPTMSAGELMELHGAAKALNSFYNSGYFRHTLLKAAQIWPGGALALYRHLALLMAKQGPGGLSLPARAQLLAEALFPVDETLFFELLLLDWQTTQYKQPLPHCLRKRPTSSR